MHIFIMTSGWNADGEGKNVQRTGMETQWNLNFQQVTLGTELEKDTHSVSLTGVEFFPDLTHLDLKVQFFKVGN